MLQQWHDGERLVHLYPAQTLGSKAHDNVHNGMMQQWNCPRESWNKRLVGENREVKIKVTKKQLEELLARVEAGDIAVDQVLSSLINSGDGFETQHPRSWRPSLQSIPEVDH
ncbi:hypothetical protein Acr_08g0000770 [Actinidia rufa]|uniref:Uncharacterized protein n=1 Tax=Actinidia rufa TaxID=165716 RepID=A0A7J0EZ19_9ERIC|nr:hypothetical protein Acr_08g0000770 [Actinidia rufa]